MTSTDPVAVARAFHEAIADGLHGDALRPFLAPTATFIEHPNLVNPAGSTRGVEEMLAASAAGAELLASQRFTVGETAAVGDTAVLRVTWTGTIAADRGPFRAGQELSARIAQFVTVADRRIVRIESYDCYEPLQPA